ncbi:uroporphyrinogen-III synthase [Meridianimarinicoccus aquatilis]|uniref:Uroporphyrinogen-III synthase n=1 Tax=Meridianimarinicoccus aquatilis TaxID=2552766 RepID=A0A4R6AZN1_9RHOB|nr:uroporphyrinogen-III synthase [Fluviibacterium aquatile]TDL89254.1 uroporphyrinogen-III synthase [Fluviibacterium aquatile]
MIATVLLTRPVKQAERFAGALRDRFGATLPVLIAPKLEIIYDRVAAVRALRGAGGVIFTSENGVDACIGADIPANLPAFCVGPRTAKAAGAAGFAAHMGPGDAAGLIATIAGLKCAQEAAPLVHLHGAHVTGNVSGALAAHGIPTRGAVVYDQRPCPISQQARRLLAGSAPVILPLFSPRSAKLLTGDLAVSQAPLWIAAISPAVAQAVNVHSAAELQIRVARHPDADEIIAEIAELLENGSFLEDGTSAG